MKGINHIYETTTWLTPKQVKIIKCACDGKWRIEKEFKEHVRENS